ncbi:hypothetical protein RY831_02470 [Noviherbaspirillum sp. CPCC 100848]|uniref:Uncharacterized protein n=1 Tax=Noviherbaspirillum album TaxID=3080276 RepID=A0ABU6J465_9BURK|nr:hypothetical protein [Noviherbaspirillum sp. CPCC 100848]MEC4718004.1 hypothetical protein [Noviherbaspirillum sp. CPCC 100848]
MSWLSPIHQAILFAIVYFLSLIGVFLLNRREFKRAPEKGARYAALPLQYKLACWFVVVPLFAGTVLRPPLFFIAIVVFTILDAFCVRWYRKVGLL